MKQPVMNRSEIKDFPIAGFRIEADKDGCYFAPETRAMLNKSLPADTLAAKASAR